VNSATWPNPRSLLVVRLGAMGDIIHTFPAVIALRGAFPAARIGWVVEERWAELLCARGTPLSGPRSPARPLVDFVHTVDTKSWRKSLLSGETRRQISAALREVRGEKYEIAGDFQGALKSAVIARFANAENIFGMEHPREAPARAFYKRRVATKGAHVIEHSHSLAEAIAERSLPPGKPEFPHDGKAEASVAEELARVGNDFVLINPGAGWGAKEWPAERYGVVARKLAKEGVKAFVNFGPGEKDLALAVEAASGGAARSISCSIGELIALTRRAHLFIGGDTGPLHLAAALQVPVVAIFGPTDPARNGPYGTTSVVLRNPASKTSLSHTSEPDPGLLKISSEEVFSAARSLLESPHA
jgi:heptosyltransferase I